MSTQSIFNHNPLQKFADASPKIFYSSDPVVPTKEGMRERLSHGPTLVFLNSRYKADAIKLKKSIEGREIFAWKKGSELESGHISMSLVIGIKVVKERAMVFFQQVGVDADLNWVKKSSKVFVVSLSRFNEMRSKVEVEGDLEARTFTAIGAVAIDQNYDNPLGCGRYAAPLTSILVKFFKQTLASSKNTDRLKARMRTLEINTREFCPSKGGGRYGALGTALGFASLHIIAQMGAQ